MTIQTATPTYLQTPGNGSATVYAFPMKCFAATDVIVGFITSTGYTLQTTGYSTTNIDVNGGGNVVFSVAPPVGTTVDIRTRTPDVQTTEFANLGAYYPEVVTETFDKTIRQIQDLQRLTYQFGIHGPDTESTPWPSLPNAAGRANTISAYDSSGLPTVVTPIAQTLVNNQVLFYGTDTGTASAYVVTVSTAGVAFGLTAGTRVQFIAAHTSNAAPTLNVNGSGVLSVLNSLGGAVVAGEIVTTGVTEVEYTGSAWQIVANGIVESTRVKYDQTPTEQAASVTPVNAYIAPGIPVRQNADATGTTDAFTAATQESAARPKDIVQWTVGAYKLSPITLGQVTWKGIGHTSAAAVDAGVVLRKNGNGTQVILGGNDSRIENIELNGLTGSGFTGNGLQVAATRQNISYVSAINQNGIAFQIGGTGATGVFNANVWRFDRPITIASGGDGVYINHSGGTVTAQFPNGTPDVNAGVMIGADINTAGTIGLHIDNTIDNVLVNPVVQNCTGKGIVLTANSLGNKFFGLYSEGNNGGGANYGDEVDILSGAYNNLIIGSRTPPLGSNSGIRDVNAPSKNLIWVYETTIGGYALRGKINIWNELSDATGADFCAYKGTNYINVCNIRNTVTGSSGGRLAIETKIDGGAVTERAAWLANGDVTFKNATNGWTFNKTAFDTTTTGLTIEAGAGRLDVVNSAAGSHTVFAPYDTSGAAGAITTNGSGTTAYNTVSDRRKKIDLGEVANIDELITAIPVRRMAMKAAPQDAFIGLYAQDVQAVAPWAVVEGDDADKTLMMDASKLVPMLLLKVQQLMAEIAELKL